jgi:hypothetical protein
MVGRLAPRLNTSLSALRHHQRSRRVFFSIRGAFLKMIRQLLWLTSYYAAYGSAEQEPMGLSSAARCRIFKAFLCFFSGGHQSETSA